MRGGSMLALKVGIHNENERTIFRIIKTSKKRRNK